VVAGALLLAGGRLRWLDANGRCLAECSLDADPGAAAELADRADPLSPRLVAWLRASAPEGELAALDARLRDGLGNLGRPLRTLPPAEEARLRDRGWPRLHAKDRAFYLHLARRRLEARLGSPEEALISLAREEERTERSSRREETASASFVTGTSETLRAHAERWKLFRETVERHHRELQREVEAAALETVPNLSAVVGPRVAARLVAAAGGVGPLARMSSSRLQLLGSRRRPAPGHGPRFGALFRAERMEEVPPDRHGAYARSLAALAVIAVRADATTHRAVAAALVARRDRRIAALQARRKRAP
jgi:snoRNA binding domain-containing protein (fibrillarin)